MLTTRQVFTKENLRCALWFVAMTICWHLPGRPSPFRERWKRAEDALAYRFGLETVDETKVAYGVYFGADGKGVPLTWEEDDPEPAPSGTAEWWAWKDRLSPNAAAACRAQREERTDHEREG